MFDLRPLVTAVIGCAIGFSTAGPPSAQAHPGAVCPAVNALMHTSVGLYYTPAQFNVSFSMQLGACSVAGVFDTATCLSVSGSGTLFDGVASHDFTVSGAMVFTGGVSGTVTMTHNVAGGESCVPSGPGADTFLLNGVLTTTDC